MDVDETNVVALTALRLVDPDLVAPGPDSISRRVEELAAVSGDQARQEVLEAIEEALNQHVSRFGSPERDRAHFNEVDPPDAEEKVAEEAGGSEATAETAVKAG
jgi:hypothetical protein